MADDEEIHKAEDANDQDQVMSMVDVLNDEQQLQEDATAVLGACDDNVCTYSQVGHLTVVDFYVTSRAGICIPQLPSAETTSYTCSQIFHFCGSVL